MWRLRLPQRLAAGPSWIGASDARRGMQCG